jgi:hypothetical protein
VHSTCECWCTACEERNEEHWLPERREGIAAALAVLAPVRRRAVRRAPSNGAPPKERGRTTTRCDRSVTPRKTDGTADNAPHSAETVPPAHVSAKHS